MHKKIALYVAGIMFALIALLHVWRLATGILVILGGTVVPNWVSVVGVIVFGLLSFWMFASACCCYSSCSNKNNNNLNKPNNHL